MSSNILRIKRRLNGAAGAPAELKNAELAYNEVDDTLYYGKGIDSETGNATGIIAISGAGAYVDRTTNQTIAGIKTFSSSPIVPTVATSDDSTKAASTAFVQAAITAGTSATADKLTVAREIEITGDASWDVMFDGSQDVTGTLTLATTGVTAGTYTKVTVDAKGRVTSATTLVPSDIPTLTADKISDFDTQVRTNRLDQMSAPTSDVSFNDVKITNLADPINDQDAATKAYVDANSQGLDVKGSVRVASPVNIATLEGELEIDGVQLVAGDRVLVKNQTDKEDNGIYVVASGAWSRADDFVDGKVTAGAFTFVEEGTKNSNSGWVLVTNNPIVVGTTELEFVQFSGAGQITAGTGMTKDGNTLDVNASNGIEATATDVRLTGQADALHNLADNGFFVRTAASTVVAREVTTSGDGISVTNGDGVAANPEISLSAALASVGGLTPQADSIAYYTGATTATLTTLTSYARSLLADTNASEARNTLGLGTMAVQDADDVAITGGTITGITIDGGSF